MLDGSMSSRNEASAANPIATIADIRRRLIRPSPTPITTIASLSPGDPSHLEAKRRKTNTNSTTNKLEDYLDPVLLSAIRSKLNNNRETDNKHQGKLKVSDRKDFKWPSDELLTCFVVDDDHNSNCRKWSDGVVDLEDDLDVDILRIKEHDQEEEEEEERVTPFGQTSVSKLFKN